MTGNKGQALLEFLGSSMIVAIVGGFISVMFLDHWHRAKCAYLVFEKVHLNLVNNSKGPTLGSGFGQPNPAEIQITENDQGILGVGRCGRMTENVRLPRLEAAVW